MNTRTNQFGIPRVAFIKQYAWVVCIGLAVMLCGGCSTHYVLEEHHGAQVLVRQNGIGQKTDVCRTAKNGTVTVLDADDPVARHLMAARTHDQRIAAYLDQLESHSELGGPEARRMQPHRIRQIQNAKKRSATDPIFVNVRGPSLGPDVGRYVPDASRAMQRMQQAVCRRMEADRLIEITAHHADVEIEMQSYFKKTRVFNTQTRRMTTMNAFHVEFNVQSAYLPDDRFTVVESGNWYENEVIIQRAATRVSAIIKRRIGPTIPAERYRFLRGYRKEAGPKLKPGPG